MLKSNIFVFPSLFKSVFPAAFAKLDKITLKSIMFTFPSPVTSPFLPDEVPPVPPELEVELLEELDEELDELELLDGAVVAVGSTVGV
jgi:hypothetical protein